MNKKALTKDLKQVILKIDGGIGKNIMALGVCKAIRNQHPNAKIIVIASWPDVFQKCQHLVDKVLNLGNLNYFYKDYIKGKEDSTLLIVQDPYGVSEFILGTSGHLIKVWCESNGIAYYGELPHYKLTTDEDKKYGQLFTPKDGRPVLLMHTNGGPPPPPNNNGQPTLPSNSWPRDLPISVAQEIVNRFKKDYNIIHLRRPDQMPLQDVIALELKFREIIGLITYSHKRLFIDSMHQHIAAAINKPSVVTWVVNKPAQFGYEIHTNIIANPYTLIPEYKDSIFQEFNTIGGKEEEFPYESESDIFDVDRIEEAIKNCPNEVPIPNK